MWDRCALVGNSGGLLSADFGKEINEYNIVVRFNQAPTKGSGSVGNKTTFSSSECTLDKYLCEKCAVEERW